MRREIDAGGGDGNDGGDVDKVNWTVILPTIYFPLYNTTVLVLLSPTSRLAISSTSQIPYTNTFYSP